ncbi:sensor histidine kinase, partial [Streptomyces sp. NPDC059556]|uniref:sensor histidine kinase n=1 Tax=Streptomyces sp. NPDC059556 TaxID=3346863 RepID=UPI0036AB7AD6
PDSVVLSVCECVSARAEACGRRVLYGVVERPVRIPVARPELVAALDALLGNVFRHTPEGTAFSIDVHNGEDAVIVLVSDAGPGIEDPAAALARGNSGARDGSTGLGLDIVRRMAETTGGDVRIGHSVLGGTEVRIWIGLDGRGTGGATGRRGHRPARRRRGGTGTRRAAEH